MIYDAIIIGGGPAGLTCAIFLGRYRRPVLLIDGGKPRNYATEGIHGFLGQHGIPPAELLARGRAEAEECGVEIRDGQVSKVEKVGDAFEVTVVSSSVPRVPRGSSELSRPEVPRGTEEPEEPRNSPAVLTARRIVLAYGVRDTLPDIPDVERYYGRTIHHCPDCDGYESRDQRIGVIGWNSGSAGVALKLLQWSDDVVLFTHGHEHEWDDEEHSKLLAESIAVVDETIVALDGRGEAVEAAVLSTGERVPVQRLFFNIHVERSTTLAEDLGCEVDPKKPDVKVNEHRETTVEGVYAIGDLVSGSQLAITAAADGAIAAIAINKSLLPPSRQVGSGLRQRERQLCCRSPDQTTTHNAWPRAAACFADNINCTYVCTSRSASGSSCSRYCTLSCISSTSSTGSDAAAAKRPSSSSSPARLPTCSGSAALATGRCSTVALAPGMYTAW